MLLLLLLHKKILGDLIEIQIKNTIKKHLDKELQLKGRGIKVLSLFFVDRVANYRTYDAEGKPAPGKFAELFEKHYLDFIKLSQYKELDIFPVEKTQVDYWAKEASESRIYGGIHFRFDCEAGLIQGKKVAEYTLQKAMKDGAL